MIKELEHELIQLLQYCSYHKVIAIYFFIQIEELGIVSGIMSGMYSINYTSSSVTSWKAHENRYKLIVVGQVVD